MSEEPRRQFGGITPSPKRKVPKKTIGRVLTWKEAETLLKRFGA